MMLVNCQARNTPQKLQSKGVFYAHLVDCYALVKALNSIEQRPKICKQYHLLLFLEAKDFKDQYPLFAAPQGQLTQLSQMY